MKNNQNSKDQQAQEYAEKKLRTEYPDSAFTQMDKMVPLFDAYDIQQAYSDGYTACEQSMWRSVEEELPEVDNKVIVRVPADEFYAEYVTVAYWDGEDWIEKRRCEVIRPSHFMYIPFPPDTNTEKMLNNS